MKNKPDLQNEAASIGVEVTVCNVGKLNGFLTDLANGKVFSEQAQIAEKELLEYLFDLKKSYLDKILPPNSLAFPMLTEITLTEMLKINASTLAIARMGRLDVLEAALEKTLEEKMKKVSQYKLFKRMELFIFMPLLTINEGDETCNFISRIREMLNKRVFSQWLSFDTVHITFHSIEFHSQALFTFSRDSDSVAQISPWEPMDKEVFAKYNVPDSRDMQYVCKVLEQCNWKVNERLCAYLNKVYPLDDGTWEQELGMDTAKCIAQAEDSACES